MDIQKIVEEKSWKPCAVPGKISTYDIKPQYKEFLRSFVKFDRKFKIVVDYANAMGLYEFAGIADLFEVIPLYDTLDGTFPNHEANPLKLDTLTAICAKVKEVGADFGAAFDGDADRCIAVDENGAVVNGDHIIYLLGTQLKRNGELVNNTVVTTVMSNLGLYHALDEEGIAYVQTKVGDRFVYENMQETGNCIGGEQSGHIILKKYATTGDGVLTAIKVMETMIDRKLPLSKLVSPVQMLPQVMKNLRVADKRAVREDEAVKAAVAQVSEELGNTGRILVRESGTEPVIRVMVEAPTIQVCETCVDRILQVIRERGLA